MATLPLTQRRIFNTWWPLAASWLLMSAEMPALSAIVARLADPEIHLAAYGGVVFPLALIIESPIVMLLPASTALSKDWPSYRKIWKFMMVTSAALTILHLFIALTPLYDVIVRGILGIPESIVDPARIGLLIMTPWTWSIAYRRFHQGVLIRFGYSRQISIGTGIRLGTDLVVLLVGYWLGTVQGVVVASSAVAAGVLAEAVFIGIVVRPVINHELRQAPYIAEPLTNRTFAFFYFPLVLTSLLSFLAQPIGSAALSRMPLPLESLACWSAVSGLIFILRSPGLAYNEVVVALLEEPGSYRSLRLYATRLGLITSSLLLIFSITPIAEFWFLRLTSLSTELTALSLQSIWFAVPIPALVAFQSWFQGRILHSRKTRPISEAVVIFLVVISLVFLAGILWGKTTGLLIGVAGMTLSILTQVGWLWLRTCNLPH